MFTFVCLLQKVLRKSLLLYGFRLSVQLCAKSSVHFANSGLFCSCLKDPKWSPELCVSWSYNCSWLEIAVTVFVLRSFCGKHKENIKKVKAGVCQLSTGASIPPRVLKRSPSLKKNSTLSSWKILIFFFLHQIKFVGWFLSTMVYLWYRKKLG